MADSDAKPTQEQIRTQLDELRSAHRELDDAISRIAKELPFDQLQLQRMKKRKLQLRDEIARLENLLIPDIIA
ncbi:MAG: YdcH family protein [Rhodospirillales bacterium]|nr:YdcH family protein [Rhodospirillales bacterium]